ncbi:MAG: O-antigen ligase family protein, partial [Burkholderiales bacterium]|nr:O-antigen ligase family protein [Burkholderiales bacterium]
MQNSKAALAIPTLSPLETRIVKLMVVLFVVFSLLPYGISWDYRGTSDLTMEGSLTTKLQWGGLFLFSAIILFRHLQTVLDDLRAMNPFLILILLWCLISSIWSPLPAVTFKRAVQLYGLVMLALCVNLAQNPLRLLLNYLLYTLNAILVLSFFMAIAIPSIGIDYELGGAWRGALSQKNELGQAAAMAILLWQVKACDEKLGLKMLFAGIAFSALMLVMSRSSTSMSITLITSIIFHLLRKRRLNSPYSMTRIFLAINCVVLVMLFVFFMYESRMPTWSEISSPVAHIFGKNSDLTGRTDIWELVWMEVQKHWLFGLGYGAFWLGPDSLSQFV